MLKKQVTNPITGTQGLLNKNLKGMYKILYQKNVQIKEKLSTKDDYAWRQVNLFRKTNRIIDYSMGAPVIDSAGTPVNSTILNDEDKLLTLKEFRQSGNHGVPISQHRLYLIITGNVPYDADNSSAHTYDINIQHKYSAINNTF